MKMTLKQKTEHAKELIREYTKKYPRHSFSFSGGKDSSVLLDLARKALKDTPIKSFAVLSDTEFKETEDYVAKQSDIQTYRYVNTGDPADCCRTPKVDTFKKAVKDLDCWFSGIRADEGITRVDFKEMEELDGLVKVNPILQFTETDVWRYIAIHDVEINPKYKDGYRSLSCAKCSVPEQKGDESERAGRWKGTAFEECECGIHTTSLRQ